jgi:carboxyl-terminal processing protease
MKPPPAPDRPAALRVRRVMPRATRLMTSLLLVVAGAGGGLCLGVVIPRAVGADPSPSVSPQPQLPEGFEVYQQALDIVREHYVDPARVDDQTLVEGSIRGMVDALGDTGHTVYLTADEVAAESEALDGSLTGIGVIIDGRTGTPVIISVVDGSPADRAGLRAGDVIVGVDGTRTDRASIDELVRLVRGVEGSTVELRIRGRDGARRDLSLVRERIDIPSVSWAFAPGTRVAVIRLAQFSTGSGDEVAAAAREALAAEASAIVLDLRGNPGGLVTEAITVASAFLHDAVVYREVSRSGEEDVVRTTGDAVVTDLPMAVLVDYGSASSAEIVAAALHDAGRAQVVGEQTFGTGTVLNVFPLSDGSAIRLGVQRWLTPDGEGIYESGIAPDIEVELPVDGAPLVPSELEDQTRREFSTSTDTQLRRAVRLVGAARG